VSDDAPSRAAPLRTETQVSAGGVAYRRTAAGLEVALVRVPPRGRWQIPKGIVEEGEEPVAAALREVREEAGLTTVVEGELETIEYWYVATRGRGRVRYHKFVHFYLLAFVAGDVRDHDREVDEARWMGIAEAVERLAFANERRVVELAARRVAAS
jgi:8-oxo-dGTP pyrophosphatase MutT (NUDIX family)